MAASVPGLLIHILLPSIHILHGLHPKQPSERVGGTHSLANNSPRNRKRNRVGIVKTPLIRKRGGEGARVYGIGTLLLAGEGSLALPGGNLYSRASTSFLSYTWRVEDTHAEQGHSSPGTWAESTEEFPRDFQRQIFPGGVATWERRREGKETAFSAQDP